MSGRAVDGFRDLIRDTGGGTVQATVMVDQVYAQMQHEALEFKHPRGGQAKYLENPLMSGSIGWLQIFAEGLLDSYPDAAHAWGRIGRKLKDRVPRYAPVEFGDLANSASLEVWEGMSRIIYEPAKQPRLTDEELDAKDWLRSLGLGYR